MFRCCIINVNKTNVISMKNWLNFKLEFDKQNEQNHINVPNQIHSTDRILGLLMEEIK